jgi:transposase
MAKPRKFTAPFKAQIALASLTREKSLVQLCREHQLSDSVISRWRQQLIERASEIFDSIAPDEQQAQQIADLQRIIGQLTVELSAAKKLSQLLG